jgi:hypothetical protein
MGRTKYHTQWHLPSCSKVCTNHTAESALTILHIRGAVDYYGLHPDSKVGQYHWSEGVLHMSVLSRTSMALHIASQWPLDRRQSAHISGSAPRLCTERPQSRIVQPMLQGCPEWLSRIIAAVTAMPITAKLSQQQLCRATLCSSASKSFDAGPSVVLQLAARSKCPYGIQGD